jgi:effector-binding domain-containing protein
MSKVKVLSLILLAMVLLAVSAIEIFAEQAKEEPKITIRKLQQQTVLYTIYRGSYEKMGVAIGNLYALAGQKGVYPRGSMCCVYLNNPQYVSSEHQLTEIRIPVGEEALKLAGTLGEMTEVKTVPAMDVAVAVKPEGVADSSTIYKNLGLWMYKKGYAATEGPMEIFLTNSEAGNYAQMKSEIMIPVEKLSQNKD